MAYGTAGLVQVYFQAEVEFIAVERVSHYIAIPPEEEESAAERQGGEAQTTVRAVSKGPAFVDVSMCAAETLGNTVYLHVQMVHTCCSPPVVAD